MRPQLRAARSTRSGIPMRSSGARIADERMSQARSQAPRMTLKFLARGSTSAGEGYSGFVG